MRSVPLPASSRVAQARGPRRPAPESNTNTKSRLRRLALEGLEPRTLLAVLPAATILVPGGSTQGDISTQPGIDVVPAGQNHGNDNTPSVVIDPANPKILVAVWTRNDPNHALNGNQTAVFAEGAYSTNSGQSWSPLSGLSNSVIDFNQDQRNGPRFFAQVTDASVAFTGTGDTFYVLTSPHAADYSSGEIMLEKFQFSGNAPVQVPLTPPGGGGGTLVPVYQWAQQDAAYKPTLAVDANRSNFTDVDAQGHPFVQSDPNVGEVYIAWGTNNNTGGIGGANPNTIKMIASSDGGNTFTNQQFLNSNQNFGNERDSSPRLSISQGRPADATGPAVPGGRVTAIWDDSSGNNQIASNRVDNAGTGQVFTGTGGGTAVLLTMPPTVLAPTGNGIAEAVDPGSNQPHIPAVTTFPLPVNITDPSFVISNLNVTVNLIHPNLAEVRIELISPLGDTITLLDNHTNADNTGNNNVGAVGANLGQTVSGQFVGTVFDAGAIRSIAGTGGGASTVGHFRPEGADLAGVGSGSLTDFQGNVGTGTAISGTWKLQITDFRHDNNPTQSLVNWSLSFTSGLVPGFQTSVTAGPKVPAPVGGSVNNTPYPISGGGVPVSPDRGVGPGAVITSDNTLGAYSPYQARLYVAYVGQGSGGFDDTNIFLRYSDDGGLSWKGGNRVNNDNPTSDGFSEGTRPQFMPSATVDPTTGTLVVSYYDARYDAARARVATTLATSIDGGGTFGPQTFANVPDQAIDNITGQEIVRGPIPDNQSSGNAVRDSTFGFGDHQGLAAFNGIVYPVWAGNLNGGTSGGQLLDIFDARAVIAAGPRILAGTMGPVGTPGDTLNIHHFSDGAAEFDTFQVTFDRPVDPSTFTPDQVKIFYRSASLADAPRQIDPSLITVTPGGLDAFGNATTFTVTIPPLQGAASGTYSYEVGPSIRTRIRSTLAPGVSQVGAAMDQDARRALTNSTTEIFAVPQPLAGPTAGAGFFPGPYNQDTLPIIVPGPHVIGSFPHRLDGAAPNPANPNLVTDAAVDGVDVVFDRDMNVSSFSGSAVTRVMGPAGLIPGPFTFTADPSANPAGADQPGHARTFRIGFPATQVQILSGTYTVSFGPGLLSARNELLDQNLNAGLYILDPSRNPAKATTQETILASSTPQAAGTFPLAIPDASTTSNPDSTVTTNPGILTSTLNVTDDFLIRNLTVQLNITHPNDPDLEATLIAPDGTTVKLFTNVGAGNTNNHANFQDTIFDDAVNPPAPIQNSGAPFFGRFNPQESLTTKLVTDHLVNGVAVPARSLGTWQLVIQDDNPGNIGTLNSWSLTFTKDVPNSGLGEPVADLASSSFRIFSMAPTDRLASSVWTAVGPAAIGGGSSTGPEGGGSGGRSGRIGGLAVDPSDPSGNTVYLGGASGGIWKTTNFLSPGGVTWIPLTDFGPTFAINIGSIAVFPRNNDPNQSIIFAATGEGDTRSTGVGFLRSMDGGASWTLLDSTDNTLPFSIPTGSPTGTKVRDHAFVGSTAYKIVVDPTLTPTGDVVVFAALSGNNGGIWRSVDSGRTWGAVDPTTGVRGPNLPGDATDVVLDPNSATGGNGNLQTVYGAIEGVGVFGSNTQGQVWNPLLGNIGDPLIQDSDTGNPIGVTAGPTPNGGFGRIALVKPALTGNPAEDLNYEGWLYAGVIGTDSHFQGLYVTKDFGQNWTKIGIPTLPPTVKNGVATVLAVPTNDPRQPNYDVGGGPPGSGLPAQGNYDFSLAIDPTNPNVLYMGGTADGQPTGYIRIDATGIADAHSFVPYNNQGPDGGQLQVTTNANTGASAPPLQLKEPTKPVVVAGTKQPYFNLIRNPGNPFGEAVVIVGNAMQINNVAAVAKWIPFDIGGTDQHRVVTFVDPLTHHARIIIGDDQGVFTAVDANGNFSQGIGTAPFVSGDINGNLQITQFYYGAAQPSNLAAQVTDALFYGSTQDNGGPSSPGGILTPGATDYGNLSWGGPGGDANGVATDQQGKGTLFQYWWPCCGGGGSDFFQVNGIGHVFGLVRQNLPTTQVLSHDTQWPNTGGANFAVNTLSGQQIMISALGPDATGKVGTVYSTENQGVTWSIIGNPSALDGTYAPALAYGAPDPNGPSGIGNLDNFLYVGTSGGNIFVTQTGGGGAGGAGNNWTKTAGVTGGGVQMIVTDPTRSSHRAWAVTSGRVLYNANSVQTAPTAPVATPWVDITGNLFQVMHNSFGDPALAGTEARYLTSIQADWRYVIPDDPTNPASPTHPVLYVGGEGGVYRSLDNGKTWSLFPDVAFDNSPQDGGFLPVAHVTDLQVALGNINPATGRAEARPGDPNVLMATTYGRGVFAIRLAPIVFPNTVDQPNLLTLDVPNGSGVATNDPRPKVSGFSEQTAFGNAVTVNLLDLTGTAATNPNFGKVIGSAPTDPTGHFTVQVNAGVFTTDGPKTLGVQAVDASGTSGNLATLTFTLKTTPPPPPPPPFLEATSDTGIIGDPNEPGGVETTNNTNPTFAIPNALAAPALIRLWRTPHGDLNPADFVLVGSVPGGATDGLISEITDTNGGATPAPVPDGQYDYYAQQIDDAGNQSGFSTPPLVVTIDTAGPNRPSDPTLSLADNHNDRTGNANPTLVGTLTPEATPAPGEPPAFVEIVQITNGVASILGIAPAVPGAGGLSTYAVPIAFPIGGGQFGALPDGSYTVQARAVDAAGNVGPLNLTTYTFTVNTRKPPLSTIDLDPRDDTEVGGLDFDAAPVPGIAAESTRINPPRIIGQAGSGLTLDLLQVDPNNFATVVATLRAGVVAPTDLSGIAQYSITPLAPLADGTYFVRVRASDDLGNSSLSPPLKLTIRTHGPTTAPTLALSPADDTGLKGDGVTTVRRPHFVGTADPNAFIDLIDPNAPGQPIKASGQARSDGTFSIQLSADLFDGSLTLQARERDLVGNEGAPSATLKISIITAPGDYHGDGRADLGIFRPSSALFAAAGAFGGKINQFGASTDIPIVGDFNGAGRDDFAIYRPSTSQFAVLYATGGASILQFGVPGSIPVPANYDGPGKTDYATYDPQTGNWAIFSPNTNSARLVNFGGPGDIPAPADYIGDGKADIAVYRPSTGQYFLINPETGAPVIYQVGTGGGTPVPGDYFGDGKADPAVYHPSTATWTILRTTTGATSSIQFGAPGDIPAPGDYFGDGHTDLAIVRPTTALWAMVDLGIGGNVTSFAAPGDIPLLSPVSYRTPGSVQTQAVTVQSGVVANLEFGRSAALLSTRSTPATATVAAPTVIPQAATPASTTTSTTTSKRRTALAHGHGHSHLHQPHHHHPRVLDAALEDLGG